MAVGVFRRTNAAAATNANANANANANVVPIRAAAEQIRLANLSRSAQDTFRTARQSSKTSWQNYAYEYVDQIGELYYAFNLMANLASRCRIFPAVIDDPSRAPRPVEDVDDLTPGIAAAAQLAMASLGGSSQISGASASYGTTGIIRDLAMNLQIAGEVYLVHHPAKLSTHTPGKWQVHSVDEVAVTADNPPRITVRTSSAQRPSDAITLPPGTFVARIWRPHPRYSDDPISSMKAILPLCSELVLVNQTIQALASSRLNAGALYLPDGLSASTAPPVTTTDGYDADLAAEEDEFEEALIEAMTTPIQDPTSPSAVVPLLIRGPAELGNLIRHISFDRPFDEALIKRAEDLLSRILTGVDVPKDIVQGLANTRYCVPTDTEILTTDGWTTVNKLTTGSVVRTLSHPSSSIAAMPQWSPVTAINTYDVDEPLITIEAPGHYSRSTLDHRWPVLDPVTGRCVLKHAMDLTTDDTLFVHDDHDNGPRPFPLTDATITREQYTGTVWCPTTATGTWLARTSSDTADAAASTPYYTGNSNAVTIQEDLVKSHIEPLITLICQSLTTTYLHPYLVSKGYTPEQASRVIVHYDSSAIANRPNRTADAQALYNAHALSGSAWRKATGFSEADAPSPNEILTRLVVERATMSPELFESLLRIIAPSMMADATENSPAAQALPPEVAQALGQRPGAIPDPADSVPENQTF